MRSVCGGRRKSGKMVLEKPKEEAIKQIPVDGGTLLTMCLWPPVLWEGRRVWIPKYGGPGTYLGPQ